MALLASLALSAAVVGAAAGPAAASALDDAKAKVIAAQQAADAAAAEYEAAIGRYEQVTEEIAALREQIRKNREEAEGLQLIAEQRAVAAYTGRGALQGEAFLTDADPLDGVRREKMLGNTKRREDNAIERLAKLTVLLEEQHTALEVRRAEQEDALAAAEVEQAQVQARLGAAQTALNELEEYLRLQAEAQRAQEIAASIARSASNRSGGVSGGAVVGGIICPIRGAVTFIDSWGAPRHQGRHQGVDLMAARGTPNVAVVSGNVQFKSGGTSGNGAYLSGDDGNLYYYFHLDSYEGGARRVAQGEVIGYVGNTGDARYTATHTHFEIHPGHGSAVNPYPSVRAVC
ncbi:MAG: peptidoglycan DD-metalloendopeptidase family protein [Acidimicrobiia bacterium]